MINLDDINKKFLSHSKELSNQLQDFIDVDSYKTFLEMRRNEKMEPQLKKDILDYINSNEYTKLSYNNIKEGSCISNNQICSFAHNYDQTGGIIKSKINDEDIFIRISYGEYEYKIGNKIILVDNKFYENGNIKCYIKTKSSIMFPFDKIQINKEVSGLNGKKRLFIFCKEGTNKYVFKGTYYCLSTNDEQVDNEKIFYWVFTKDSSLINEEKILLNTIEKITSTYLGAFSKTEIEAVVKQRVGQSFLKDKVYNLRKECEITHIRNKKLLIASHIKPWSKSNDNERLDMDNILLLSPLYDKLFDKGFISFDNNGHIIVSKKLDEWDKKIIFKEIKEDNIKINITRKMNNYMEFHRTHVFEKFI